MGAGNVGFPGAGEIEGDGVGHVLGVSAGRPLRMIEAVERVEFDAGEEFAVTLDGRSKSAGGEFWNAEIAGRHDI